MNDQNQKLTYATLRTKLDGHKGRTFWKSIDEVVDSDDFLAAVEQEYPSQSALLGDPINRRKFMKIMGASFALAGLTACGVAAPEDKIVPYVKAPENMVPGKTLQFATGLTLGGVSKGVLVTSYMGRPIKIEGNPDHPASLGATDAFTQAALLGLYDPDRSQAVRYFGEIRPWDVFSTNFRTALAEQKKKQGAGIRILTENVTSPTIGWQFQQIQKDFPQAKWHQYEPANRDHFYEGMKVAFGSYTDAVYQFDKADVVLALEADFLTTGAGAVRYTRDFMSKRKIREGKKEMNRLYVAESMPSSTGAVSDHRLPLKSSDIETVARAVAAQLGVNVGSAPVLEATLSKWVEAAVKDLKAHKGACLVVAGDHQPPVVHALVQAINQNLENVGKTVTYIEPVETSPVNQLESLKQLVTDINSGAVELLLIVGGNPVYNAPVDFKFEEAMKKVKMCIHLSLYHDETSHLAHWHIPQTHELENWSDARAYEGTVNIIQPLIAPLYKETKSLHEILAMFTEAFNQSPYSLVRDYWRTQKTTGDFESFWRKALHDGVVPETARPAKTVALQMDKVTAEAAKPAAASGGKKELHLQACHGVYDGRFANNGWLQELPKPLTKLTWDNAALMSWETAQGFGVANEDLVELTFKGRKMRVPVWIVPGHAKDSVTVHLGYGRTKAGHVAEGAGFNAYALRSSTEMWGGADLSVSKVGERYELACTQEHFDMNGGRMDEQHDREIIRVGTLEEYKKKPDFAQEDVDKPGHDPLTLFGNDHPYTGRAWGLAIDTSLCTGCNACVVACVAENNSPVVGKDQVRRGREMQWIRIDQYFSGDIAAPQIHHQPVMCQHCEAAPCEVVCPVAATTHSTEGINEMTYNRCIGTKYCSNNCPYKVRRFNFLAYQDFDTPVIQLGRNPNVTVRSRGVMEKCTFCVQRVNAARIEAEKENRPIADGEIKTACQQVCPAEAIVFGDLNDKTSRVAKLKAEPTGYGLLGELNTRPRVNYLATIRNPNSELGGGGGGHHGGGHE
ncbi:MAG: TAT-variant-translocated molybdopterin oxidoreductase [Blastocatellia bacterium]|nr:TAT-variant-translocated molybdopterin oxidoreductase [Blastocatellia bacterium]